MFSAFLIAVIYPLAHYGYDHGFHDYPYFPVKVLSAAVGFSFLIAGFLLGRVLFSEQFQGKISLHPAVTAIIGVVLIILSEKNTYLNMCNMALGKSDILYVLTAVFWSLAILYFSQKLELIPARFSLVRRWLAMVGRHTLFMYLGHQVTFYLITTAIAKIWSVELTPMIHFPWYMVIIYFSLSVAVLSALCYVLDKKKR